ncbi:MAG: Ig-like domain-containing protein [Gemmatimonadales bacterium]
MPAHSSIPALLCTLFAAATACSDTSSRGLLDPGGAALLVVAPSAATIKDGTRLQLNLSAHDETGQSATPSNVTWTTSNEKIATVAEGIVTGRGPGSAQITAWWNGVHGASLVTVVDPGAGSPSGCGGAQEKSNALLLKKCLEQ